MQDNNPIFLENNRIIVAELNDENACPEGNELSSGNSMPKFNINYLKSSLTINGLALSKMFLRTKLLKTYPIANETTNTIEHFLVFFDQKRINAKSSQTKPTSPKCVINLTRPFSQSI